jgi:hypothetical protein
MEHFCIQMIFLNGWLGMRRRRRQSATTPLRTKLLVAIAGTGLLYYLFKSPPKSKVIDEEKLKRLALLDELSRKASDPNSTLEDSINYARAAGVSEEIIKAMS